MDTAGWDLIFAISIDAVNRALLANQKALLTNFDLTQNVKASGTYGSWKIVPGGSGQLVNLALTISAGQVQRGTGSLPLAGAQVTLKVELALLPTSSGQHLTFDFTNSPVTLVNITGVPALGEIGAAALGAAIAADLAQRADQITFVLASVSPVGSGGPTWLNPAKLAFSYAVPAGKSPVLGIFAVTTNVDISRLDRDVDPVVIGSGEVGLAMAPSLFLMHVFGPALAAAFGTDTDKIVSTGPNSLGNNGQIGLPSVSKAGEDYYPKIDSLSATLADDHVAISLAGNCDMHMNINMSFNAQSSVAVSLGSLGNLSLHTTGQPSFSHDVSIPWYDHLLDIVAVVAEAILDITVAAISSELADGISHVAGTSEIVTQAPGIVGWVGTKGFTATQAGLDGAFYLQGNIS